MIIQKICIDSEMQRNDQEILVCLSGTNSKCNIHGRYGIYQRIL